MRRIALHVLIAACLTGVDSASSADSPTASTAPLWSLQPFHEHNTPAVQQRDWPAARVDHFILAKLEQSGLQPSTDADPATLLRRLHFDLIGLPPSLDEIAAFERAFIQNRESSIQHLVDRLLASPEFGARWGRHWLDVARYAESSGNTRNMAYPLAWRYRNWVVSALNRNVPFDRFIRMQIAGDLLPAASALERDDNLLATGFLNVGVKTLGEQNLEQYELNIADDQIDATCRAFLALTASCARCHDHKFDPIPTRDYYALAGIFRSTQNLSGVQTNNRAEEAEGMPLGANALARMDAVKQHAKQLDDMQKEYVEVAKKRMAMKEELTKAGIQPTKARPAKDAMPPEMMVKLTTYTALEKSVDEWQARLKSMQQSAPAPPVTGMAVQEKARPADSPLYDKGEVKKPLAGVPRGALTAVPVKLAPIKTHESGRRQLADWIASAENPLTARVIVNRVWQHLFGVGLVATPDDFGRMGASPTHPELLDDLAFRFARDGWDVKALIRELACSRAYRMSSRVAGRGPEVDAVNTLLWRMNRKPLEAEPLRDSILFLGGGLDHSPLEGSQVATLATPVKPQGREVGRNGFLLNLTDDAPRRSVYLPAVRGATTAAMQCFDCADPNLVTGARRPTIVPTQSLFLMNSDFTMNQARGFARRLMAAGSSTLDHRIDMAWRMAFARVPSAAEQAAIKNEITSDTETEDVWTRVLQALMMAGEFRTVY
jgi:hypothetical protein